ncbi:MAG: hypothetical protein ABII88_00260 [Candidatus Omnitrophota bacterium]
MKRVNIVLLVLGGMLLLCAAEVRAADNPSADEAFLKRLTETVSNFLKDEQFLEAVEYLDKMHQQKDAGEVNDLFYIEYYILLTKSQYLDYLAIKEDWQDYYNSYHDLDTQIINKAKQLVDKYPLAMTSIDIQYLAWKAYVREEDEAESSVFDKLVSMVISYTAKKGDIVKFKEVADLVGHESGGAYLEKLFKGYQDYLISKKADIPGIESLAEIAQRYMEEGRNDMSRVVYERYMSLIRGRYPREQGIAKLSLVADKFRADGFSQAKDAEFAEIVYSYIEEHFGSDALAEKEVFSRAYNLELSGNYERAVEEYKKFVKTYKESDFLAEAYSRLGIINFYVLAAPEQAIAFFQKAMDISPESPLVLLCIYETALYFQWKEENEKARELYTRLVESNDNLAALAKQRLEEIDSGAGMPENLKNLFNIIFTPVQESTVVLTLTAEPEKSFVNQPVKIIATAQDFAAGTVQPLFVYDWLRDTGKTINPGNVTEFTTEYESAGPKVVCFIATLGDSKSAICRAPVVYDVKISSPLKGAVLKIGEQIDFKAEFFPFTYEDEKVTWQWNISGPETISGAGKVFSGVLNTLGTYTGELKGSLGAAHQIKKFDFKIGE